jgi:predicted HicB family RNase H-like nuclease
MFKYKNYIGQVTLDIDAEIFHGEVINTKDVITFQGRSVSELKKAFVESIEDYLSFCKSRGEEAERPFSGKFNIRLSSELHRKAYIAAKKAKMSLNTWIEKTIEARV